MMKPSNEAESKLDTFHIINFLNFQLRTIDCICHIVSAKEKLFYIYNSHNLPTLSVDLSRYGGKS